MNIRIPVRVRGRNIPPWKHRTRVNRGETLQILGQRYFYYITSDLRVASQLSTLDELHEPTRMTVRVSMGMMGYTGGGTQTGAEKKK